MVPLLRAASILEHVDDVRILNGDMYYSLNPSKGGYIGDCIGNYYRAYQGGHSCFRGCFLVQSVLTLNDLVRKYMRGAWPTGGGAS